MHTLINSLKLKGKAQRLMTNQMGFSAPCQPIFSHIQVLQSMFGFSREYTIFSNALIKKRCQLRCLHTLLICAIL